MQRVHVLHLCTGDRTYIDSNFQATGPIIAGENFWRRRNEILFISALVIAVSGQITSYSLKGTRVNKLKRKTFRRTFLMTVRF
jgi:hypothetical protein